MKILEYKTAHGDNYTELDQMVNELIGKGFQPYGSPYLSDAPVAGISDSFVVMQAVVRYDN
jgi:hypothetical protein